MKKFLIMFMLLPACLFADKDNVMVFSGGGVSGIAYSGAIKAYEHVKGNALKNSVDAVVGTSVGSITAAVVAMNYTSDEITSLLSQIDFTEFEDSSGKVESGLLLLSYFGVYRGEVLHAFLRDLVEKKMGDPDATLLDVQNKTGIKVEFVITDIANSRYMVLSSQDPKTQNISLATAARTSSSFPGFFSAMFFQRTPSGELKPIDKYKINTDSPENVTAMIDGGLMNNYPIHHTQISFPNSHINGFLLLTTEEIEWFLHGDKPKQNIINNIRPGQDKEYLMALLSSAIEAQYVNYVNNETVLKDTVLIDRQGTAATDFDLTDAQKQSLIKAGCQAVINFYDQDPEECKSILKDAPELLRASNHNQPMNNFFINSVENAKNNIDPDTVHEKMENMKQFYNNAQITNNPKP